MISQCMYKYIYIYTRVRRITFVVCAHFYFIFRRPTARDFRILTREKLKKKKIIHSLPYILHTHGYRQKISVQLCRNKTNTITYLGPILTYEYFINSHAPYITNESDQTGFGKPDKIVFVHHDFCSVYSNS